MHGTIYPIPDVFAATGLHFGVKTKELKRFQVIGERSSGTNFIKRMLGRNTPLKATEDLGWKHGYPHMLAIPEDLLVVVAVRNAKDWVRSMFSKPWHAKPALQRMEFSDFIRSPWRSVIDRPRYFEGMTHGATGGRELQLDRDPISGLPYPNLFALRQGKLLSHLSFSNRGCAFCLVRMEDATANPDWFITSFRAAYGFAPLETPVRPILKRLGSRFAAAVEDRPKLPAAWDDADLGFLREECDPDLEHLLGYHY